MFSALNHSILRRAQESGKITINYIDIRDFSVDKNRRIDDYPYGGGAGMIMACEPIYRAYKSLNLSLNAKICCLSPSGKVFNQKMANELADLPELVLLCGHYEGIDQRIIDEIVDFEISLGDFVLSGGEIAAMAVVDAVARQIGDVISQESLRDESFSSGLLEYPQYTRPYEFMGHCVPGILLSGHHKNIENWRMQKAQEKTQLLRPDLLK